MADNHLNEAERTQDEADALADLRKAVQAGASDDWLLGFIRGYPFARRTPVADGAAVDLPPLPTLPRYLLDMIGEYGMARTDSIGQLEVQHRWEILIGGIKQYAADYAREAISHYLRKQAGQVGEQPTKGESNAGA